MPNKIVCLIQLYTFHLVQNTSLLGHFVFNLSIHSFRDNTAYIGSLMITYSVQMLFLCLGLIRLLKIIQNADLPKISVKKNRNQAERNLSALVSPREKDFKYNISLFILNINFAQL